MSTASPAPSSRAPRRMRSPSSRTNAVRPEQKKGRVALLRNRRTPRRCSLLARAGPARCETTARHARRRGDSGCGRERGCGLVGCTREGPNTRGPPQNHLLLGDTRFRRYGQRRRAAHTMLYKQCADADALSGRHAALAAVARCTRRFGRGAPLRPPSLPQGRRAAGAEPNHVLTRRAPVGRLQLPEIDRAGASGGGHQRRLPSSNSTPQLPPVPLEPATPQETDGSVRSTLELRRSGRSHAHI